MPVKLTLPVPDPDDLLLTAAYGAGALIRIERAATQGGSYTEFDTVPIVAATTVYTLWDDDGYSTSWYKRRYSNAGNTVQSAYSLPFTMGASWTNLARVKTRLQIDDTDTDDDAALIPMIQAANAQVTRRVGVFLGPSTDTVRTYDGSDAMRNGKRLWIVGGIRTCTQLEVKYPGGDWATVTSSDYRLGPNAAELRAGQPYGYIEFLDYVTGSYANFPSGQANARPTGTFGADESPDDIVEIADKYAVRLWQVRQTGQETDGSGFGVRVPRLLPSEEKILDEYRAEHFASAR